MATQTRSKKPYIGRRTGKVINIVARKNAYGFENIDDYFPDSDSVNEEKSEKSQTESENDEKPAKRKTAVTTSTENGSNVVGRSSKIPVASHYSSSKKVGPMASSDSSEFELVSASGLEDESSQDSEFSSRKNNLKISVKVGSSSRKVSVSSDSSMNANGECDDDGVKNGDHSISPQTSADDEPGEHGVKNGDHSISPQTSADDEPGEHGDKNGDQSIDPHSNADDEPGEHGDKNGDHGDRNGDHGDKNGDHGDKNGDHSIAPHSDADDKPGEHGDQNGDHSILPHSDADSGCGEHGDKNGDHSIAPHSNADDGPGEHGDKNGDHSIAPHNNADSGCGEHGDKNGDHSISSQTSTDGPDSENEEKSEISTIPVKKKRKKLLGNVSTDEVSENVAEGPRRGDRHRVRALQYWMNERIQYERRKSGLSVKDVIVNPSPQVTVRKRKKAPHAEIRAKKGTKANKREEELELSEYDAPEGLEEEVNPVVTVINSDTLKEVKMKLIHSGEMLDFQLPLQDGDDSNSDSKLLMDKYFSHDQFGAGEVILRPGAEKGRQHVRKDTMVFHINSGRVLVTIHEDSFVLARGSSFFVPEGNVYNLKNLDMKKDASLFFTQIKG